MNPTNKAFQRFCNKYMVADDRITFNSKADAKTYCATANDEGVITISEVNE